jgi:hypothetical protein
MSRAYQDQAEDQGKTSIIRGVARNHALLCAARAMSGGRERVVKGCDRAQIG